MSIDVDVNPIADAVRSVLPEGEMTLRGEPMPDVPEGHVQLLFSVTPTPAGVQLRISIGDRPPHQLEFSSEADAAAFIRRGFASLASATLQLP